METNWEVGEFSDTLGYDCMTGAIRVGPCVLDGSDYGQRSCQPISKDQLALMKKDAALIAAAPDLFRALVYARRFLNPNDHDLQFIDAAISKATAQGGGKGDSHAD